MKTKVILTIVFLSLLYIIYFRWFAFSHSVVNGNVEFNLPDFVDRESLLEKGFNLNIDNDIIDWSKSDKFNLRLGKGAFSDSLTLSLITSPRLYPYVDRILLNVDSTVDKKILALLNASPDSIQDFDPKTYFPDSGIRSSRIEFYTIDPNHKLIRKIVKYDDSSKISYSINSRKQLGRFQRFIARLPFVLTFDDFAHF